MPCPRCQREPPSGAEFCPECGAKVATACAQCGTLNDLAHRFCTSCGRPLASAAAERAERGRPPRPRGIPQHLAEKILSSRSALEGERKQVTVLFADLQGSMELIADRDPEIARKILDPVIELMMEAVHRYEGTVNQVMGDGIMALFGAPIAHEDDAVRACYAALRMQGELRRYAEQVRRSQGVTVRIRVGLNSGEVVVRAIGNDLHMDYTAIGQTTHLAARMEQLADPGSILLTAATFAQVEGYVEAKPHGPISVKGLSEPVEIYELVGAGLARTRFQAATMRGLVRFVGREAEIEQLRRAMTRAAEGRGQIVAVVGEAGVGKSRLFFEFTHSQRLEEWLLLESGSVSYGRTTAYLLISELLRAYFKIDDRDDARQIRAKVVGRMTGLEGGLEALLPPILALLDVPVEDPGWTALDAAQRRRRTIDVVKRLLLTESQAQPLLLVLEDLHWIDSETQAVLDSLVESLGSARVLALINYRPGYEHRWAGKTYYTQIRLENLPPDRTSDLLRALLGDEPRLEPLKRMLIKRGNPLFLEETVRALVERRALQGHPGAYQLVRPVESLQIPSTVQSMLAARIDTLREDEKQLLQAASVIGNDVPYAILAATTDLPEETLRRALSHLQEAEFLYETSLFPELEYTFKHALTHDVAYASLVADRKRALHAVIVGAMERVYADRLDERVGELAHHAFRGELWDKAVIYLRRAGHRAVARSASREAIASFERALAALEHLPEDRRALEAAVDIRAELQSALIPVGDLKRMLALLAEAEAVAEKLGDQRRLGHVTASMSHCLWWTGEPDRSAEVGQRALAIASSLEDLGLRVISGLRLIQASFARGDYRRAIEVGRSSLELLREVGGHDAFGQPALPSVTIRAFVGKSQAAVGDFEPGFANVEEAIAIAQQLGHPYTLIIAYWGAGDAYLTRGELIKAIAVLERGLELCRRGDFVLMAPIVTRVLGEAYALAGRHDDGLGYEQRAAEQLETLRYIPALPTAYAGMGEAQFLAGRSADALRSAHVAVDLSRRHGQRGTLAMALRVLGDVLAQRAEPDAQAGVAYGEALTVAQTLEMRPLAARCCLGLGRLEAKAGRPSQARAHLDAAASQCRAMGMTLWAEQADAALLAVRSGFD